MPTKALPQPTGSYVDSLYARLNGVWTSTHQHWQFHIDPWYHQEAKIWPAKYEHRGTYVPSTARGVVEHATDSQLAYLPTISRPPIGTGDDHQKDADDVENALFAIFMDAQLKGADISFKQAGKYMNAYGYCVMFGPHLEMGEAPEKPEESEYDADSEEFKWADVDYKNARKNWNPVRFDAPHPARVLMDPQGGRRPPEAVHRKRMWRGQIADFLDSKRDPQDTKTPTDGLFVSDDFVRGEPQTYYEELTATEYWSKEWHALALDGGSLLLAEKNAWGYQPYSQAFAGFGMEKTGEEKISARWLAEGLLDAVLADLKVQAQAMSGKQNGLIESVFRRRGSRKDTAEANAQYDREDATLQGEKTDFWFEDYPDLARWVFQFGAEIDAAIEWGTYSRSAAGSRAQGVSTVGQQAILSTAVAKKFVAVSMQLNMLATDLVQHILKLVDRLGEDISIGGKTLKVAQIHNDYSAQARFELMDPIIQLQRREVGLREVQMKIKSPETYREQDAMLGDESQEQRRLIKQIMREHPALVEMAVLAVAEEDGLAQLFAEFAAKQQEAAGGLVGPDGKPISSPQTSDQAGGGGPRALRQALTGETAKPAPVDLAGAGLDRAL